MPAPARTGKIGKIGKNGKDGKNEEATADTRTAGLAGVKILGVFPHPDDEAYSAAGTLNLCSRHEAETSLLIMTRGEAGNRYRPNLSPEALATLRTKEMEASAKLLGVRQLHWLDLPDGGVEQALTGQVQERLNQMIQDLRPDLVLTLGDDGVYAHCDHTACTRATGRAVAAMPEGSRPLLLHAAFPAGLFAPVRNALSGRRGRGMLDAKAPAPGIDRNAADIIVNIEGQAQTKENALASHASQMGTEGSGRTARQFLVPGLVEPLLREEWFQLVSPGGKDDAVSGEERHAGT